MSNLLQKSRLAVAVAVVALTSSKGWAQGPAAVISAPKPVTALNFVQTPAAQVAAKLSKTTGMTVLTDSSLAGTVVTFSSVGGPLDSVLKQLSAKLPTGTMVRAALVPEAALIGPTIDGDKIAAFLKAQDAFTPLTVGIATLDFKAGEFDLLGQGVTLATAAPLMASLHLRPVYLLILPRVPTDPVAKMSALSTESMRQYQNMTPDQRKAAMEQQFHSLMNMDPVDRKAMLGQMMQQAGTFMTMMKSMTPEQQQSFQQEMVQAVQGSGLIPPPQRPAPIQTIPGN